MLLILVAPEEAKQFLQSSTQTSFFFPPCEVTFDPGTLNHFQSRTTHRTRQGMLINDTLVSDSSKTEDNPESIISQ